MSTQLKSAGAEVVYLNVKQLAELLKVKPRTVYGWVANPVKSKIPVERAVGGLRFRLDKILRWTEEGGAR